MKITEFDGEHLLQAIGQIKMEIRRLMVFKKVPEDIVKNVISILQTSTDNICSTILVICNVIGNKSLFLYIW